MVEVRGLRVDKLRLLAEARNEKANFEREARLLQVKAEAEKKAEIEALAAAERKAKWDDAKLKREMDLLAAEDKRKAKEAEMLLKIKEAQLKRAEQLVRKQPLVISSRPLVRSKSKRKEQEKSLAEEQPSQPSS